MKYLIKNAKVISAGSKYNGKRLDILVHNGTIVQIGKDLSDDKAQIIKSKNLKVSVGWFDIGVHLGEPGHEHRETMSTLCRAALAGGYTDIAPFPVAEPTIQTRSQIKSLISEGLEHGVDIHPIGALSTDTKGENIAEYMDMTKAGTVAISDGLKSVQKNGLLLRALQYAKGSDSLVIHHPTDHSLSHNSSVHEGTASIKMGLKGEPAMAEHMMVDRDIKLQEYSESKLCLHGISSKVSLDKIVRAKKDIPGIHTSVTYLNLVANEDHMLDYNTNYKVSPVLRTTADQNSLIKGVLKGNIDYISSNHTPLEPEQKMLEFSYAKCGATGLETVLAAINSHADGKLSIEDIIPLVTTNPRAILGISQPTIEEGSSAKLTCWDESIHWTYNKESCKSRSHNNPYWEKELTGKVVACFNQKAVYTQ